MVRRILRQAAQPIRSLFLLPAFRCSAYYMAAHNLLSYSPREEILRTAMEYTLFCQVEGDYLEFGVCEGRTFLTAYHLAQRHRLESMRFYAFDSFQGLPEITGVDAEGFRHFARGEYCCTVDRFKSNIRKGGADLRKTEIVQGWFGDVLTEQTKASLPTKAASIIWVDCDLYESTVPVLNFITDLVQDGTFLIFDDWFCFRGDPNRGQQRAFREWLQRNPSLSATPFRSFAWHGNSFIVHRS